MTTTPAPRVSVVVPTLNRSESLKRCLNALLHQTLSPDEYEIIVVNDGGKPLHRPAFDEIAALAAKHGPGCRYLLSEGGPAAARNTGWRAARAPVLAFTDDDCLPDADWLRAGLGALSDGVAGLSGRIIVPLPQTPTDYERDVANLENAEFATANCFYRRDVLHAVNGFDERFTRAWREDADLFLSLLERGSRLERAPRAVVIHPIRPAAWGTSLQQQSKSLFNALLYKKHPTLYWERIQHSPPWRYYATVAALVVALTGACRSGLRLAVSGGSVWLFLTVRFCRQRLRGASTSPAHVSEMAVTSALIPVLSVFWRLRGAARFRVLFL